MVTIMGRHSMGYTKLARELSLWVTFGAFGWLDGWVFTCWGIAPHGILLGWPFF